MSINYKIGDDKMFKKDCRKCKYWESCLSRDWAGYNAEGCEDYAEE